MTASKVYFYYFVMSISACSGMVNIKDEKKVITHQEKSVQDYFDAREMKDLAAVEAYIASGADINKKITTDEFGTTLLMDAAHKRQLRVIKRLLEAGANPNVEDYTGLTALHYGNYFDDVWKTLLEHGANPNKPWRNGQTPLIQTLLNEGEFGPTRIGMLLLHGADPNIKDKSGKSAHDYAANEGKNHPQAYLLDRKNAFSPFTIRPLEKPSIAPPTKPVPKSEKK